MENLTGWLLSTGIQKPQFLAAACANSASIKAEVFLAVTASVERGVLTLGAGGGAGAADPPGEGLPMHGSPIN
jgi:hypothetical protein